MRDYLYLWRDPRRECLVASGLEFKDFQHHLRTHTSGVVLLKHGYNEALEHPSGIEFVPLAGITALIEDDPYDYGDLLWADFLTVKDGGWKLPEITDRELAELLFFRHTARPLGAVSLDCIKNQFLFAAHDDGWSLRVYAHSWEASCDLLRSLAIADSFSQTAEGVIETIEDGTSACFISRGEFKEVECSEDIDSVLGRYLKPE